MKKTAITVLVTLGLGTSLFAFGPGGHCKGPSAGEERTGVFKLVRKLDLTSEQKSALKSLRESQRSKREEHREAFKKDREFMIKQMRPDMSLFMSAESFDKKAFKEEMTKKFEARRTMREAKQAQMLEKRASGMEKVFNILTPEQRIKWIELSKKL